MIVFDLICDNGHRFEAWFRSGEDFDRLVDDKDVACPYCGDTHVMKAITAPRINSGKTPELPAFGAERRREVSALAPNLPEPLAREMAQVMAKVRDHVEQHCDYVGENFAEEARAIHYGEVEPRGIYGEATGTEAIELQEEGIDLTVLPGARVTKSDA